ncbi:DASH complex subunit dam1 [Purpureocillium takamizusanense]|uniref:DASH complex subunit DAM1 n=1 Tax=Purpureocillium takamizusanense TaxID=2060973 RepID=A0A9Q8V9Z8_9HYPO|nr:DASH complex subunit dam1 [Purpureocillium takamizusanense]UNI17297.1 DASH complex subunit dam1 [Purpureocillium takamizusanense]
MDYESSGNRRPSSRTRVSRPTTPLRPSSRSSFRDSARSAGDGDTPFPLNTFEPAFAELSDAMADLEANMMHFQLMHESLARFSESFASFLYGLNMNAFCVDFPEGPIPESFRRDRQRQETRTATAARADNDVETTFMTTDTSFVENPPASSKRDSSATAPELRQSRLPYARGHSTRGRSGSRARDRGRASGLARPRGRGVR